MANVPKPTRVIESLDANVDSTVLVKASMKRPASALVMLACSAMALTSSVLFMIIPSGCGMVGFIGYLKTARRNLQEKIKKICRPCCGYC